MTSFVGIDLGHLMFVDLVTCAEVLGALDLQSVCADYKYRDEIYSLQIQLSRTQAGPSRAVEEQQEPNSP